MHLFGFIIRIYHDARSSEFHIYIYIYIHIYRKSPVNVLNLHTAIARKAPNGAGSSRSICELGDDAKILVMTDIVLVLYLVPFVCFF